MASNYTCTFICLLILGFWPSVKTVTVVPISPFWQGGFEGHPCIPITAQVSSWKAHLEFDMDVNDIDVWAATYSKISPRHYELYNMQWNGNQSPGSTLCFNFLGYTNYNAAPYTTIYIEGMDGTPPPEETTTTTTSTTTSTTTATQATTDPSQTTTSTSSSSKDYTQVLQKSILFYAAQRSGPLPADNPIDWRGDSALADCVPGGWYDAGDGVKFGLPMASSTTLLLWSLLHFKDGYVSAARLDDMYDLVQWPLDYFLKAWDSGNQELLVQIGDPVLDHAYWGRHEEMTMSRPCTYIGGNSGNLGSEIAGETAAALAAGSLAFADKGDTSYATELLTDAESLYSYATSNRGLYYGASLYYNPSEDEDELCVAAMFLYQATGDSQYLNDAIGFAINYAPWSLSWDNKFLVCHIMLYEATGDAQYSALVESFFTSWSPEGGMTYTPCGLAWRDTWGSNRYAANAAFAALVAAEMGINPADNQKWAVEQINYMLGDNQVNGVCFSFVVGYGQHYPLQPHHRAASCPDLPESCTDAQLYSTDPNPQILNGALVGGPDASDNYDDIRTDYERNEVSCDYNAGFQGALAAIVQLESANNLPATTNACPCSN